MLYQFEAVVCVWKVEEDASDGQLFRATGKKTKIAKFEQKIILCREPSFVKQLDSESGNSNH